MRIVIDTNVVASAIFLEDARRKYFEWLLQET
jgi:predicted nucleic acid-binding protein